MALRVLPKPLHLMTLTTNTFLKTIVIKEYVKDAMSKFCQKSCSTSVLRRELSNCIVFHFINKHAVYQLWNDRVSVAILKKKVQWQLVFLKKHVRSWHVACIPCILQLSLLLSFPSGWEMKTFWSLFEGFRVSANYLGGGAWTRTK